MNWIRRGLRLCIVLHRGYAPALILILKPVRRKLRVTAFVQDAKAAEVTYPGLRFSFTVPSLGGYLQHSQLRATT
jgi:hypothetical protein